MALDTFANLKTAVATLLNRDDLTSAIPDFIVLAEAQMQRDLRHWRMETRTTATASSQYVTLPTDFYEPLRLHIQGKNRALRLMALADLADHRWQNEDTAGEPRYFALTGGEIELWPTPGDSYTLEILYRTVIVPLSDAAPTNWILDEAPDAYLYGAALHSAPFLRDDKRADMWASLYKAAVNNLNDSSNAARWSGQLRMR